MAVCWQTRECEPDIIGACPHAVTERDMCPSRCTFSICDRETHVMTTDPALVFDPTVDRNAARKQSCLYCEHFLKHGPRRTS
ncbi:MAG: hypothetical protein JJE36_00585 [Coriobacteriia bacterium]|nr:hypothetical protein [Coriobacteriia bacterium]